MTTRFKGAQITFARDIREDDAEALLTALRLLKGVQHVHPVEAVAKDTITEMRLKQSLRRDLQVWADEKLGV